MNKDRARYAAAVGCVGAWFAMMAAALVADATRHPDVARVLMLAGLPWLFVGLWLDRRPR